ncbi:hypothetical protein FB451DRAFT_1411354 [Mycena latifolia]|nr:hypothetical protein FB451DRAFT_1411354 [Mycena latifolia]
MHGYSTFQTDIGPITLPLTSLGYQVTDTDVSLPEWRLFPSMLNELVDSTAAGTDSSQSMLEFDAETTTGNTSLYDRRPECPLPIGSGRPVAYSRYEEQHVQVPAPRNAPASFDHGDSEWIPDPSNFPAFYFASTPDGYVRSPAPPSGSSAPQFYVLPSANRPSFDPFEDDSPLRRSSASSPLRCHLPPSPESPSSIPHAFPAFQLQPPNQFAFTHQRPARDPSWKARILEVAASASERSTGCTSSSGAHDLPQFVTGYDAGMDSGLYMDTATLPSVESLVAARYERLLQERARVAVAELLEVATQSLKAKRAVESLVATQYERVRSKRALEDQKARVAWDEMLRATAYASGWSPDASHRQDMLPEFAAKYEARVAAHYERLRNCEQARGRL